MATVASWRAEHRPPTPQREDARVYIVYFEGSTPINLADEWDAVILADNLFLVRTAASRSRLYHAVKRRLRPDQLLVAPLADDPKFMGMAAGALKWVRNAPS